MLTYYFPLRSFQLGIKVLFQTFLCTKIRHEKYQVNMDNTPSVSTLDIQQSTCLSQKKLPYTNAIFSSISGAGEPRLVSK